MEKAVYLDETKSFEERAKALVAEMTLEEKVFQTVSWAKEIKRLGVKAYNYWNEALHGVARAGVATVFPQAIGLAAMFDENFIEKVADVISTEGRGKFNIQQQYGDYDIYKGLTFWSPNVNIFRDPRWGRGHETFGEDPYLTGRLGTRFIKGIQGHDRHYLKAAACAKHFAVHSGPEDLRHSFNAKISNTDLHETYLAAFKECVEKGKVEAVMGAYNRINGEPCCGSEFLLKSVLRTDWGFKGHVTSDCWAIKDFHESHMVTKNAEESAAKAMNAGCDLNCGEIYGKLINAVSDGLVKEETITGAVVRLFVTRMKLGLFDDKKHIPFSKISFDQVDSEANRRLNLKAAEKSLVLLKNENNILPLDKKKINSIGVIGPNADNRRALVGNYEGTSSEYVTVLDGIREAFKGTKTRVIYSEGCHLFKNRISELSAGNDRAAEVRAVCAASDVIVACFGLDPRLEGEEGDASNEFASGDRKNLNLPGIQEDVIKEIVESGKPVILVIMGGSALALGWEQKHIPAIIDCFYPGALGGRAAAKIIFGNVSPEGKLPVTFYEKTEDLPEFTDYSMKNRTYRYMSRKPLYPFGYGLTYSEFSLKDIKLCYDGKNKAAEINPDEDLKLSLTMINKGNFSAAQTVQVYIKPVKLMGACDVEHLPVWQLKALKKVSVRKGESKKVSLNIEKEAFGLYGEDGRKHIYPGEYEVFVGTSQPDLRSIELTGEKPVSFKLRYNGRCVLINE